MSGLKSDDEKLALGKILQVLDQMGLNRVQKVLVLTGAIRRVTGIE